jgi:hypothetical protein
VVHGLRSDYIAVSQRQTFLEPVKMKKICASARIDLRQLVDSPQTSVVILAGVLGLVGALNEV